jgi:legumain
MKVIILLALVLSLVACQRQWAVLVAGSNTYSNYRHQADVFHAYQTLIRSGFDKEYIITFAYDDIANSVSNPYKGKVFNKPSYANAGVDVYAGVTIDYRGVDVTPDNFLAALEGNEAATKGKKVLKTTPNDKVFIFFSDHGSPGLIAFPSKYLYADQLLQTFNKITGKFDKLVFYLEVLIAPYRPANPAQCSKNCQLTLTSTVSLLQIPASLHGELTAVPTMWSKAST